MKIDLRHIGQVILLILFFSALLVKDVHPFIHHHEKEHAEKFTGQGIKKEHENHPCYIADFLFYHFFSDAEKDMDFLFIPHIPFYSFYLFDLYLDAGFNHFLLRAPPSIK